MPEMTTQLVSSAELVTPHLSQLEKASLLLALNTVILGTGEVYVSMTYAKQTQTRKRLPNRDYVAMPGVAPAAFFGPLVRVSRRKKDGGIYFFVPSATRGDGGANPRGPTNLLPAGVKEFVITGYVPNLAAVPQAPAPQQGPGAP